MKSGMWAAWLAVAALASACGGGDDDARPPASGTTDALAPFVGRWQAPCLVRGDGARLASSTVEAPVYLSIGTEMTVALNGGRLEGRMTERFYNDDTCTTTVLATQSRSVSFTNDGPVTASGRAALKTTVTAGPTFAGISATNITMGSVTYINTNRMWTTTLTLKDLAYLEANRWYWGAGDEGADGYPSALELNPAEAMTRLP